MWTYEQRTGIFRQDGKAIGTGYSGHNEGKNNPSMESHPCVGPIPKGLWSIGSVFDSSDHGPVVMRLTPEEGTDTFGRSGFLIHGDSIKHPGDASLGCIILGKAIRLLVAGSSDRKLQVV